MRPVSLTLLLWRITPVAANNIHGRFALFLANLHLTNFYLGGLDRTDFDVPCASHILN